MAERTLFFHSKEQIDPRQKNKRMTICCVIDGGVMKYGISTGHDADKLKWNRALGRKISEGRARGGTPVFYRPAPEKAVKVQFIVDCHNLVALHLREKLGSVEAFKIKLEKVIRRKQRELEKNCNKLSQDLEIIKKFYDETFNKTLEKKYLSKAAS